MVATIFLLLVFIFHLISFTFENVNFRGADFK